MPNFLLAIWIPYLIIFIHGWISFVLFVINSRENKFALNGQGKQICAYGPWTNIEKRRRLTGPGVRNTQYIKSVFTTNIQRKRLYKMQSSLMIEDNSNINTIDSFPYIYILEAHHHWIQQCVLGGLHGDVYIYMHRVQRLIVWTNRSCGGQNLSRSQQQGYSATYSTRQRV